MKMKRGFTMVELMVVIGIIAILVSVLISSMSGASNSARTVRCKSNMRNLAAAYTAQKMIPIDTENTGWYSPTGEVCGDNRTCPLASKSGNSHKCSYAWIDQKDVGDTYEKSARTRTEMVTNGFIWVTLGGATDSLVCPCHRQHAMSTEGVAPVWSYVMNGWFGCSSHKVTLNTQHTFGNISRPERVCIFAEIPGVPMTIGGTEIQTGKLSGRERDPALDYASGEVIGFNHKVGKKAVGNVAFFDGHVEQYQAPTDKSNIKELTEWLCDGGERADDSQLYFDISFNGSSGKYEKNEAE